MDPDDARGHRPIRFGRHWIHEQKADMMTNVTTQHGQENNEEI